MALVDKIAEWGFGEKCVICGRKFTDADFQARDIEAIITEPMVALGRFIKTGKIINGKEETELRTFHKGTTYHESCYYKRKYRLDN